MRGGEEQRRGPALPTHDSPPRSRSQGRGGSATLSTDTFRATVPQHVRQRAGCVWTPRHAANSRRRTPSRGKRRGTGGPEGLRPGDTGRGDTGPVRTRTRSISTGLRGSRHGARSALGAGAQLWEAARGPGRGRSPRTRPAGPVTVGRGRTAGGLGGRGSAGRATAGFAPWGQGAGRRGTCHGRGRVTADDSGLRLEPWRARRLRLPGRRKAERGRREDRSSRLDRGKPLRSQESGKQVPARSSLSQRDRPRLPRRLGAAPRLRP